MTTIVKPHTFAGGANILASEHNSNNDTIFNDYNGSINSDNIAANGVNFDRLAALTTGSVPFADGSGALTQDNSNLFWDDTNNRLGIGVNSGLRGPLTIEADGTCIIFQDSSPDDTREARIQISAGDMILQTGDNTDTTDGQFCLADGGGIDHQAGGTIDWGVGSDNAMFIRDAITAPTNTANQAKIFVDTADGDLKVIFADGFTATIAADS